MPRIPQLTYYTLVLAQKHTADERQDGLAAFGHNVRLHDPGREG